ncbi:MAG: T9SS type A sorting domain-containing protein [Bacteroidetes bacterium]|nr:T9SS type A sorting domain-containing protein [Bacteroidota bacterium]
MHCEIAVSDVFEYSGFEIPISYTSHEYRWLSPDMGIPVLQINTQALLGFETVTQVIYQDTLLPAPVSIQENLLHADITLQNPVSNTMQIAIQAEQAYPMYLIVKDTKGATVLETKQEILNTGINNFSYSINNLESGMYLVNVVMDNRVVEVKKLIVLK